MFVSTAGWVMVATGVAFLILAGLRAGLAATNRESVASKAIPAASAGLCVIAVGATSHFVLPLVVSASSDDPHPTPSAPSPPTAIPPAPSHSAPSITPSPQPSPDAGHHFDTGQVLTWVGIVAAVLLLLTLIVLGVSQLRRSRERRTTKAAAIDAQWSKADEVLSEVDSAYTAFHTDLADRIFSRPLLDDTDEPLTAAFINALNEAHACAFDTHPRDWSLAARALSTAQAAQAAWTKASTHARQIGLGSDPAQRRKLTTARRLLDQALDPGIAEEYRKTLMDRITTLIAEAGSKSVPPVRSLIDEAVQRSLSRRAPRQLEAAKGTPPLG